MAYHAPDDDAATDPEGHVSGFRWPEKNELKAMEDVLCDGLIAHNPFTAPHSKKGDTWVTYCHYVRQHATFNRPGMKAPTDNTIKKKVSLMVDQAVQQSETQTNAEPLRDTLQSAVDQIREYRITKASAARGKIIRLSWPIFEFEAREPALPVGLLCVFEAYA